MLTGSDNFVKAHLVLQRDQIEWLDRQAKESALGRSAVARMLLRERMQSDNDDQGIPQGLERKQRAG